MSPNTVVADPPVNAGEVTRMSTSPKTLEPPRLSPACAAVPDPVTVDVTGGGAASLRRNTPGRQSITAPHRTRRSGQYVLMRSPISTIPVESRRKMTPTTIKTKPSHLPRDRTMESPCHCLARYWRTPPRGRAFNTSFFPSHPFRAIPTPYLTSFRPSTLWASGLIAIMTPFSLA